MGKLEMILNHVSLLNLQQIKDLQKLLKIMLLLLKRWLVVVFKHLLVNHQFVQYLKKVGD
ncbi:unnamed protein product [Meloidogyne enterolobii]|uniref:Uncharacterized protein n=1 Tax=Meloidogyne enterolobii TaxID=390850 RepID=A0ACB0ZR96_MELEN